MKTRNIISILLAVAGMLSVQSCLKDQKDYFEEPSSTRMENFLAEAKDVLTSNTHGWIMEYYPGTSQKYGGYTYVLKFTGMEVEAFSEISVGKSCKSYYKFTTDNGPVISFDTNNELLHYFATPSSDQYQAMGGDFEFMITSVSPEKVGLLGKRSQNHYDLYPLPAEYSAEDYIAQVAEMSESVKAATLEGTIGNQEVIGDVDLNNRRITFSLVNGEAATKADDDEEEDEEEDSKIEIPFMYTPTGIKTYNEMKIGGCTFQEIAYLQGNNIMTNGVFALQGKVPEDYTEYDKFLGQFALKYYAGTVTVTIERDEAGKGFIMKGLNKNFDLKLGYHKSRGRMTLGYQNLGTSSGSNYVVWMPWDANEGYITWADGVGMEIYRDLTDESGNTFKFCDNGVWEGNKCDSFLLYEYDGAGNRIGSYSGWGSAQYPFLETLKRK